MLLTGWGASQGLGNAGQIDDDSLDAVSFAFNLGLETLHLVAVEGIGDIPANVDGSHDCGSCWFLLGKLLASWWMQKSSMS